MQTLGLLGGSSAEQNLPENLFNSKTKHGGKSQTKRRRRYTRSRV